MKKQPVPCPINTLNNASPDCADKENREKMGLDETKNNEKPYKRESVKTGMPEIHSQLPLKLSHTKKEKTEIYKVMRKKGKKTFILQ